MRTGIDINITQFAAHFIDTECYYIYISYNQMKILLLVHILYHFISPLYTTADVTPPTLVLLTEEQFSNENFTINWNVSEEVTAICTLQTPAIQYTEICNNKSFTATQLQEGLHFLFVQATDLSGNPGPALRYGWIVGEHFCLV